MEHLYNWKSTFSQSLLLSLSTTLCSNIVAVQQRSSVMRHCCFTAGQTSCSFLFVEGEVQARQFHQTTLGMWLWDVIRVQSVEDWAGGTDDWRRHYADVWEVEWLWCSLILTLVTVWSQIELNALSGTLWLHHVREVTVWGRASSIATSLQLCCQIKTRCSGL